MHSGGHTGDTAWFAYGSAPGHVNVTIAFDGRSHEIPVGSYGVWAFTGIRADPSGRDEPAFAS